MRASTNFHPSSRTPLVAPPATSSRRTRHRARHPSARSASPAGAAAARARVCGAPRTTKRCSENREQHQQARATTPRARARAASASRRPALMRSRSDQEPAGAAAARAASAGRRRLRQPPRPSRRRLPPRLRLRDLGGRVLAPTPEDGFLRAFFAFFSLLLLLRRRRFLLQLFSVLALVTASAGARPSLKRRPRPVLPPPRCALRSEPRIGARPRGLGGLRRPRGLGHGAASFAWSVVTCVAAADASRSLSCRCAAAQPDGGSRAGRRSHRSGRRHSVSVVLARSAVAGWPRPQRTCWREIQVEQRLVADHAREQAHRLVARVLVVVRRRRRARRRGARARLCRLWPRAL